MHSEWQDRLSAQLDRDQPGWHVDWAEARDLRDFVRDHDEERLKRRTATRLFHGVLGAAVAAGLVLLPPKDAG